MWKSRSFQFGNDFHEGFSKKLWQLTGEKGHPMMLVQSLQNIFGYTFRKCLVNMYVGCLEHEFYDFLYIYIYWECHHPNWLSYFSGGLKPPTSVVCTVICQLPVFFTCDWWQNDSEHFFSLSFHSDVKHVHYKVFSNWLPLATVSHQQISMSHH